jgi:hypothetical protein
LTNLRVKETSLLQGILLFISLGRGVLDATLCDQIC